MASGIIIQCHVSPNLRLRTLFWQYRQGSVPESESEVRQRNLRFIVQFTSDLADFGWFSNHSNSASFWSRVNIRYMTGTCNSYFLSSLHLSVARKPLPGRWDRAIHPLPSRYLQHIPAHVSDTSDIEISDFWDYRDFRFLRLSIFEPVFETLLRSEFLRSRERTVPDRNLARVCLFCSKVREPPLGQQWWVIIL